MSTQPAHRFSWDVDRYHRAIDTGVFTEKDHIELVEGELRAVPPIGPAHQSIVDELGKRLVIALGDAYRVRIQGPVTLPPRSEPQPDVLVARAGSYSQRHPGPEDALVAIEVSDSSRERDETEKLPLYARYGIPECWIVDISARVIRVNSRAERDGYTECTEVPFAEGRVHSPTLGRSFDFEVP